MSTIGHTVMCSNCDRELMRDECITYPESPKVLHCPKCFDPLPSNACGDTAASESPASPRAAGTGLLSSVHICAHCQHGMAVVPVTEANWAGLLCVNSECITVDRRNLITRLQMIADAAKDGASLTWIRAVALEGIRGEPFATLTDEEKSL